MKIVFSTFVAFGPLAGFAAGLVAGVLLTMPSPSHATMRAPEGASLGCSLVISTGPMASWRHKIESDRPLFDALSRSEPAACVFDETEGVLRGDYRFANGNTLRASRDTKINHMSLIGRLTSAPVTSTAVMAEAERSLFGSAGCGIDWSMLDSAGEGTTELRGDKCGCRASVDRSRTGAITFFSLRAACKP